MPALMSRPAALTWPSATSKTDTKWSPSRDTSKVAPSGVKAVEAGWHWLSPTGTVAVWVSGVSLGPHTGQGASALVATTAHAPPAGNHHPPGAPPPPTVC